MREILGRFGGVFAIAFGCLLIVFGVGTAYARDDEAISATKRTLIRYASIRRQAKRMIPEGSIVLSERSDKIFVGSFAAVSPLPDAETIHALSKSGVPIFIFHRSPSSNEDIPQSLRASYPIEQWATVFRVDREGLYMLVPPKKP
jgi:hypothetical protein